MFPLNVDGDLASSHLIKIWVEPYNLTCSVRLCGCWPVSMVIHWCDVDAVVCVCQQRLQNQAVLANRKNPLREQTLLVNRRGTTQPSTPEDQVIRETGRKGGRERKGGRKGDRQGDLLENEEGQECIQGTFDEKKRDRRGQKRADGLQEVITGDHLGPLNDPPSSYRLLFPFITAVAESIMLNVGDVDGLPGHTHAERGLLIDPDVPHSEPGSCGSRETRV